MQLTKKKWEKRCEVETAIGAPVSKKLTTLFSSHSNFILYVCVCVFIAVGWLLLGYMIRETYEESQTAPVSHAGKPILAPAPCLLVTDPLNKSCGHSQLCSLSLYFPSSTNRSFMWRFSASHTQAINGHPSTFRPVLIKAQVPEDGWTSIQISTEHFKCTPLSTLASLPSRFSNFFPHIQVWNCIHRAA